MGDVCYQGEGLGNLIVHKYWVAVKDFNLSCYNDPTTYYIPTIPCPSQLMPVAKERRRLAVGKGSQFLRSLKFRACLTLGSLMAAGRIIFGGVPGYPDLDKLLY